MAWVQSFSDYLLGSFEVVFYLTGAGILLLHHFQKTGRITPFVVAICGLTAVLFVIIIIRREAISIFALTSVIWLYGVCLYVVLCDFMIWKLARLLTSWRKPKWTKELDYVYLTLALLGIVGSLNKFDFVTGRVAWADVLGPLVITTAVVIRYIKTRAEIEGWNNPDR
jgi:hypothetical protein